MNFSPLLKIIFLTANVVLFSVYCEIAYAEDYPRTEISGLKELTWGGFVDTYLAHDFNGPKGDRPYTTQALVDDEMRVNLGFIDVKLDYPDWRGRLAIQGGDSVRINYSSEEDLFWRYMQESTVGYKISDNLWLDAGIYLSHIGLESFNSRDNWNYTRSLVAEYSPYYETGAKLSYEYDDRWSAQVHILKGWQNISQEKDPALGMQIAWATDKSTQFIYNNFIGNEHGLRVFNELLAKYEINEKLSVAAQFDLGNQNQSGDQGSASWHGWAILARYKLASNTSVGGRVERYSDPHQVLVSTPDAESFNTVGLSANVDYEIIPNLFWRNEYRVFFGQNEVFPKDEGFSSDGSLLVTSLSYSF